MGIVLNLPIKFKSAFLTKCRYVIAVGGRGGGKSYSFAIIFLLKALASKCKILCVREIQSSIKDSVYETLLLAMDIIGVRNQFDCTYNGITCKLTGSTFIFSGLYRNIESIKSIPGINYVWIAEADKVSEESLNLLFPTIREEGSQIFADLNPCYETDPIYKRFILNPPPDVLIINVSWRDNPFISQTLLNEKDNDFATRPQEAEWIWNGKLKTIGAQVWCPPFDPTVHIREFDPKELKDYKVFMALDPHTSFYSAAIWGMRWKQGDRFYTWIFQEWPRYGTVNAHYSDIRKSLHWTGTVADLAREFYASESGYTITERYIDTRFAKGFGSKQSNLINTTEGLVETFAKQQNGGMLFLLPQEVNIDAANDKIKADLRWNQLVERNSTNEPCLFISSKCSNLIRALKHHRYEDDSEKELETFKDMSDCLTQLYGGLSEYRWPTKSRSRLDQGTNHSGNWMGN